MASPTVQPHPATAWPLVVILTACAAEQPTDATGDSAPAETDAGVDSEVVPDDDRPRVVPDDTHPADTCAQARALTPITQGIYEVEAGDYRDDLRRSPCLPFGSPGPDMILPLEVPAGATVMAGGVSRWDTQIVLLDDCDLASTCLAGADLVYASEFELLTWVNDGGARTVYAVLDFFDQPPASGPVTVRVIVEAP